MERYGDWENTLALIGEQAREMTQRQLDVLYRCVKCIEQGQDAEELLGNMIEKIMEFCEVELRVCVHE